MPLASDSISGRSRHVAMAGDAGGTQGPHRDTMIGLVARDDLKTLGLTVELEVIARNLQRTLVGFGAARGVKHPRQMRRGHVDELPRPRDRWEGGETQKAGGKGEPAD